MQRKAHLRLESEINETAIAVLNPAVPPLRPAFPMLTLNLLVAGVLGTLLGIGAALLVEVSDRRVRLTSDLVEIGGVPVLAVLKRARRRDRARQARAAAAAGAA
jgi:capsular polysaccharide biosynthesis protein